MCLKEVYRCKKHKARKRGSNKNQNPLKPANLEQNKNQDKVREDT